METALFWEDRAANPNFLCHFFPIRNFCHCNASTIINNYINQNCSNLEILADVIHAKILNLGVCLLDK